MKSNTILIGGILAASILTGCMRSIELTRSEHGYDISYLNVGLKTDVSKIEVERATNGFIRVCIDGVQTDVSAENKEIVAATGTAVGNVAKQVVEGVK